MSIDPNSAAEVAGSDDVFSDDAPSAEDSAYFESEGEAAPAEEAASTEQPEAAEAPAESEESEASVKEGEKQKFVPHQALHAEREERKKLAAELDQTKSRFDQIVQAMQQQQQPEPEPIPAWDEAPIDRMQHVEQDVIALRNHLAQQAQMQQEQQRQQTLINKVSTQFRADVESTPVLENAYQHTIKSFYDEAKLQGASDEQARAHVQQIELGHAENIQRMGISPGKYIEQLALSRGWHSEPATAPPDAQNDLGNQIDRANAGMERNKSLSSASGGAVPSGADIASMSDDEFGDWFEKHGEAGWAKEAM